MLFFSTRNKALRVTLKDAVLAGLADDGGLFLPETIGRFTSKEVADFKGMSAIESAQRVAHKLLEGELPAKDLNQIIERAITFEAPLTMLEPNRYICELFHGPTLAFKDFGARFLAQMMGYFVGQEGRTLTVLVATSGDTGGAVAAGFHRTPGIEVVLLYPENRVSPLQEHQLTSFGDNIHALRISGSFDDCQAMVKQAFQDTSLREHCRLTSANSINIARLIPQTFYYFSSFGLLPEAESLSFFVPSGNFGNLTAGLFARRLGLPIKNLVAGTNSNDTVPDYLRSGHYQGKKSQHTISNAMDVGDPSNIERINSLCDNDIEKMRCEIQATSFTDQETRNIIKSVYHNFHYILDPHTAIAWGASQRIGSSALSPTIALATAHPIKFSEIIESTLGVTPATPQSIIDAKNRGKKHTNISADYQQLREFLVATKASGMSL